MKTQALTPTSTVGNFLPIVHCFRFHETRYAYLVRTGDLIRVSSLAYEAFSCIERGLSLGQLEEELRSSHPDDELKAVLQDLGSLEDAGYLSPELNLAPSELDGRIDSLLAHRPRNIMFFVTEACNLACAYCYEKNQGVHDQPATMKQVDARKTLEAFFREAGGRDCSVTFFGGEPLLNFPVIRDAVHYSKQLAARHNTKVGFTMTTNLTLLTDEIADFLAENAFHVMVSLDGSKEQNDRYRVFRGGGGTYETVERNLGTLIAKMKEAGVRLPKVRATMTTENSDPIAIEQHIKSLGTHLVEIGETHGTAGGGKAAYDVGASSGAPSAARRRSASLIESAIQALERDPQSTPDFPVHIVKSLQRIQETVTSKAHKHSEPKLCGVCRNMKAVTPGGDLYPCHRYVGMPEFKIGNIHEGGVDKQKAKQYYEGIYNAFALKCSKCWARHLCGGQCPWYLSRPDGTIVTPDDSTCDTIRESFETYLGLYSLLLESFPAAFQRVLEVDPKTIRGQELGQAPDLQCGT